MNAKGPVQNQPAPLLSVEEKNKEREKNRKSEIDKERELRILVIDDSDFIRKDIIDTLIKEGFGVVGDAKTAQDAMPLIPVTKCNLIILDLVMPDVGGIEFSKFIKEKFPFIQIIMVSSLTHEYIILEAIAAGALDFIYKPFTKQQLIDAVMKVAIFIDNK